MGFNPSRAAQSSLVTESQHRQRNQNTRCQLSPVLKKRKREWNQQDQDFIKMYTERKYRCRLNNQIPLPFRVFTPLIWYFNRKRRLQSIFVSLSVWWIYNSVPAVMRIFLARFHNFWRESVSIPTKLLKKQQAHSASKTFDLQIIITENGSLFAIVSLVENSESRTNDCLLTR